MASRSRARKINTTLRLRFVDVDDEMPHVLAHCEREHAAFLEWVCGRQDRSGVSATRMERLASGVIAVILEDLGDWQPDPVTGGFSPRIVASVPALLMFDETVPDKGKQAAVLIDGGWHDPTVVWRSTDFSMLSALATLLYFEHGVDPAQMMQLRCICDWRTMKFPNMTPQQWRALPLDVKLLMRWCGRDESTSRLARGGTPPLGALTHQDMVHLFGEAYRWFSMERLDCVTATGDYRIAFFNRDGTCGADGKVKKRLRELSHRVRRYGSSS